MKDFVKRMIIEHKELLKKIDKLEDYMISHEHEDNTPEEFAEFADKAVQLEAMKSYARALGSRIERQNVCTIIEGEYFERVNVKDLNSDNNNNNNNNKF